MAGCLPALLTLLEARLEAGIVSPHMFDPQVSAAGLANMNRQQNKMTTLPKLCSVLGRHEDGRSGVIMQELTAIVPVQLCFFPDQIPRFQTSDNS